MRVLWKYIRKGEAHYSWTRWDKGDRWGYFEVRFPPSDEDEE